MGDQAIETLFEEDRRYPPRRSSRRRRTRAGDLRHPVRGVLGAGRREPSWFEPFRPCSSGSCRTRSGTAGKINVAYNCLDRHVEAGSAIASRSTTRASRSASALRSRTAAARRGRSRGERPEGARRRQGHAGRHLHGNGAGAAGRDARVRAPRRAAHRRLRRVLAEALADRLNDMRCEVLLTQDESFRRGTIVPLKRNADERLSCPGVRTVVVGQRTRGDVPMTPDATSPGTSWSRAAHGSGVMSVRADGRGGPPYLLYTSGTTASRRASRTRRPATSSASRRRTTTSST